MFNIVYCGYLIYYKKSRYFIYVFVKNLIFFIYFLYVKFSGYFVFKLLILVGEIKKIII